MRLWKRLFVDARERSRWIYREPWVAELLGLDARHGFERQFLRAERDYSQANETGSRGVFKVYWLYPDRIYEVHQLRSWSEARRYFCRAEAGRIVEMTKGEVEAWLENAASASMF